MSRIEELEQVLETIRQAEVKPEDNELFATVVRMALSAEVATSREFADEFECAPPTVKLWCTGTAAPLYGIRAVVYRFLKEKIQEKLKQ